MTNATAPATTRVGETAVNAMLDVIITKTSLWTTDQLADKLARDTIIGTPNTDTDSPVGLYIIGKLQQVGLHVTGHWWSGARIEVYADRELIGEATIPDGHTLYDLDCETNDGLRPELTHQGEGDQR